MFKKLMSVMVLAFALVGCQTNCSSQFVNEYNQVVYKAQTASILASVSSVQALRSEAISFRDKHNGEVCDAEVNGERTTIDATAKMNQIIAICDAALGN